MDIDRERICRCALNMVFGFKPAVASALIDNLGSASAVMDLDRSTLDYLLGPFVPEKNLLGKEIIDKAAKELQTARKYGGEFIHRGDKCYPLLLGECPDAPVGFYYRGVSPPEEIFSNTCYVSVVGTRDISPYGREWCERIVSAMSACEPAPCIVSGLALGTDITAHNTALRCGLATIAVMATGIESIYPSCHNAVAERIASTPGCALVSDYPVGTVPHKQNFLRRNRIIAGMSSSTILIESKIRGGGMMTAGLAFSYGRNTYALPGRVDDLRSQGCNYLIASNSAAAISDCTALVDNLGLVHKRLTDTRPPDADRLSGIAPGIGADKIDSAAELLLQIKEHRGIDLDELTRATRMPYKDICSLTTALQREGLINIDLLGRCRINTL